MFRVSSRYSVSLIETCDSAPEHSPCDLHFILAFSIKMIINRLNLRSGLQTRIWLRSAVAARQHVDGFSRLFFLQFLSD